MKILLCTPRMGIGGAETHVLTLAEELVRLGHRVTVASSGGFLVPLLEKNGVRHLPLPLDKKTPVSIYKSLHGLKKAAADYDVVHAHGRYPAFLCGILSGQPDFPAFVTTAHGITGKRQPQRALSRWGEATVSVSDTVSAYLQEQHRVPKENIRFIPNGVRFPAEDTEASSATDGIFRIAAAGRFEKDTAAQFLQLIAVTERLCDEGIPARLILFGGGKKENIIGKSAGKANRKHPGCVVLYGETGNVSADLKTEQSDVFVGQSRAALEAMAAGIPTVIFSEKGCPGVLSPENADLLFRSNYMPLNNKEHSNKRDTSPSEALFSLLRALAYDADFRKQSAAFAQDFVRTHNALPDIVRDTLDFYASVRKKHRPGIVLSGYFGADNLGDEATLRAVTDRIRKDFGPLPCYVLTRKPGAVPAGCTGIRRVRIFGLRKALRASRLFLLCGGSLLQNRTSNRSLWYYSAVFRAAKKAGLRTQIWGGGIGPLQGKRAERTVQKLLSQADAVGLRDAKSLTYAQKYTAYAYHSADAVLSCPPQAVLRTETDSFAVCPRSLQKKKDTDRMLAVLADAAGQIQKKTGAAPLYFALAPEDDPLCRRLARAVPGEICRPKTPEEAQQKLFGAGFCISVRLHGAILSLSVGTPSVCLSYDPKVEAFAREAALPCFAAVRVTPEDLLDALPALPDTDTVLQTAEALRARTAGDRERFSRLYSLH